MSGGALIRQGSERPVRVPPQQDPAVVGEAELLARMRRGDAGAFAVLMRLNNRRLYRLARGILRDDDEAEEAVQEGYVRAFTHLEGFKGEASLATWLARIVVNEALGRRRRRRVLSSSLVEPSAQQEQDGLDATSPEQAAARREIRRIVERAIDGLPRSFRTVFVLRAVEQLSIKETAALLDIREETVKTRFHRANRLLRGSLGEQLASIWDDAFPFAGRRCEGLLARVLARLGH